MLLYKTVLMDGTTAKCIVMQEWDAINGGYNPDIALKFFSPLASAYKIDKANDRVILKVKDVSECLERAEEWKTQTAKYDAVYPKAKELYGFRAVHILKEKGV